MAYEHLTNPYAFKQSKQSLLEYEVKICSNFRFRCCDFLVVGATQLIRTNRVQKITDLLQGIIEQACESNVMSGIFAYRTAINYPIC